MATISKEEYLKRYLSNADAGGKKKRKKKIKTGIKSGRSLIIDDDVNLNDIKVKNDLESHENLLELADENPLIFNETGTTVLSQDLESIKKKEEEKKAMWAPVRNIQDEVSSEIMGQTQVNATDSSPITRGKVKKIRHDSLSPERNDLNNKEQAKIDRIKAGKPKLQRHDSSDTSPHQHSRHDSSSDQSPIRHTRHNPPDSLHQRRNTNARQSSPTERLPVRKTRHDSSSDQSPPRMQQFPRKMLSKKSRNDLASASLPRDMKNVKSRSPTDQSPPRRNRSDSLSDHSPSRSREPIKIVSKRGRHDSPDLSPPKNMGPNRFSNQSPPKRARHDSPDLSPPRRNVNRLTSPNHSQPRRQQTVNNKNQVSDRRRHDSPDLSPPRMATNIRLSPPDQSPPRKQSEQDGRRPIKGGHDDGDFSDQSPPRKQKSAERKAGLHSAAELRQENEKTRQRENEMFARMSSSTTGKGADTIHRDKAGRKRDFKVEEVKKREEERKKQEENEKFMEWGKGVQQSKTAKDKVHDDLYEMSKPLARYKDDTDLDQMLKERDRAGDPMLAFVQKKKAKENRVAGKKEKPRYKGPAPPPNRFNIPPGYRWDGVDRSNGFEKKRFSMLSNKGATREEAYKWSTEDM